MRKVDRLFEIIQLLRGQRLRTAEFIAGELGVSVRTIYRDIAGLSASGVPIEGERGVGYLISQPIEIPPLQFTPLELKALKMGADLVKAVADKELAAAAVEASLKIVDALPENHRNHSLTSSINVHFRNDDTIGEVLLGIRNAIDKQQKSSFDYLDKNGQGTLRTVRPLGLEFWRQAWTFSAWCEMRHDFRLFRIDRVQNFVLTGDVFVHEKGKTYADLCRREKGSYLCRT